MEFCKKKCVNVKHSSRYQCCLRPGLLYLCGQNAPEICIYLGDKMRNEHRDFNNRGRKC